ncbi:unnamed protein product [Penicillium nalgiovense]|nr:unnamed protein product [Penicillium nalgiovense]
MDPAIRQGLKGPECGKEVHIEDDIWIGGSVVMLAGVRIGKGSTVGAGSVVTKVSILRYNISTFTFRKVRPTLQDVPPFHFVTGNPGRVIRRIETSMNPEEQQ